MSVQTQMQQHPMSIAGYLAHGWYLVEIEPGTKGPRRRGWQKKENMTSQGKPIHPFNGFGLAHAYSGTMALDIDDFFRASLELATRGINLHELYNASDAVVIDSGRPGHGKLLYAMPFGASLPSKKLIDTDSQGRRYNYLDFRCGTANGLTMQDVLPPTLHSDTNQPYRWAGRGHWSRLPVIPDALLHFWMDLLEQDKQRSIGIEGSVDTSWDEIHQALHYISPDCSRDEWIQVGMALHWAGTQTDQLDQAAHLWDDWSKGSATKYPGPWGIDHQWRSFRADKATSVTLGTLFHHARQAGWQRPQADASGLFSAAEPALPDFLNTPPPAPKSPDDMMLSLKPPAPNLNFDHLPDIIKRRALEVSEHIGCDPLIPAFAGLSAVSGAIDARTRLELMPGFKVPPVLWVMTIGDPADKKTPGSAPMFDILKQIEAEDRPMFAKRKLDWEAMEAQHGAAKKAFLEYAASTDFLLGGTLPTVPDLAAPPAPLRITVSDVTSQKLIRVCAERDRGVLCYLDEMNGWIKKVTNRQSGEDRSSWVSAYESKFYEMDRVGGGSIHCDNFAVSVYGNLQPRVFQENVAALSEDGLLQRFIPVPLRAHFAKVGNPVPDYLTCRAEYDMAVRTVYGLPGMTYTLSPEAYNSFRAFQHWYEAKKRDERLLQANDTYMTAFGKLEGLVGRLALIWHVIDDPYSIAVSQATMDKVIRMVMEYLIPSLRYTYSVLAGLDADPFDEWMMKHTLWVCDETEQMTLRGIGRSARKRLPNHSQWQRDAAIIDSMALLEASGWVVRVEENLNKRHVVWSIDPRLKSMFADRRREVVKAKQRRVDEMYGQCFTWEKIRSKLLIRGYDPETMDDELLEEVS